MRYNRLEMIYKFYLNGQMLFNVEKCLVMHIGTNNKLYSYNMNNATLKAVDVERDLGVIINKNGKNSEQCLMAAKKANCVLALWTPDVFSQTSPWRQTFFRVRKTSRPLASFHTSN